MGSKTGEQRTSCVRTNSTKTLESSERWAIAQALHCYAYYAYSGSLLRADQAREAREVREAHKGDTLRAEQRGNSSKWGKWGNSTPKMRCMWDAMPVCAVAVPVVPLLWLCLWGLTQSTHTHTPSGRAMNTTEHWRGSGEGQESNRFGVGERALSSSVTSAHSPKRERTANRIGRHTFLMRRSEEWVAMRCHSVCVQTTRLRPID